VFSAPYQVFVVGLLSQNAVPTSLTVSVHRKKLSPRNYKLR
jgi:hypothetical protein